MKTQAAIAIALMITTGRPAIASSPSVSPGAGSDTIRAARSLSAEDAILFDYRIEVHKSGQPDAITTGGVTLAADFVAVSDQNSVSLDDYTLCRVLRWSVGKPMENQSCYWGPAFRQRELANRRGLRAMLDAVVGQSKTAKIPPNLQRF